MNLNKNIRDYFESAARRLCVTPERLAILVDDFDTIPLKAWPDIFDFENIEMSDIASVRSKLFKLMAKESKH